MSAEVGAGMAMSGVGAGISAYMNYLASERASRRERAMKTRELREMERSNKANEALTAKQVGIESEKNEREEAQFTQMMADEAASKQYFANTMVALQRKYEMGA